MRRLKKVSSAICVAGLFLVGCTSQPVPGPDKQFAGGLSGAVTGAGAGAVTGFQLAAGLGPGAAVGAGVGAVAGSVNGYFQDQHEEALLDLSAQTEAERAKAWAHEMLVEHYKQRLALFPTRDIFPADWFFFGDESKLKRHAKDLIAEMARLNKERLPWSELVVAAYVKSSNPESVYAKKLADRRAHAIGDALVKAGLEARRVRTRAVIIAGPLVVDPQDDPERYNQAIELIALDR